MIVSKSLWARDASVFLLGRGVGSSPERCAVQGGGVWRGGQSHVGSEGWSTGRVVGMEREAWWGWSALQREAWRRGMGRAEQHAGGCFAYGVSLRAQAQRR